MTMSMSEGDIGHVQSLRHLFDFYFTEVLWSGKRIYSNDALCSSLLKYTSITRSVEYFYGFDLFMEECYVPVD